jgi:hypothetical protein
VSTGDADYSPLFVLTNAGGHVYNGPIVASGASVEMLREFCDGIPEGRKAEAFRVVHDKVVSICPNANGLGGTVTLRLTPGFSFARPVLYLRCSFQFVLFPFFCQYISNVFVLRLVVVAFP